MLCLRKCVLSCLLSPPTPCTPSTTAIFPLLRLLSATATPFAVEDYLVARCHLTPAQALKASKALSHLKPPSKPEAVLAFLSGSGLGLSDADIATAVAKEPTLLCSRVDRTLAPRLAELQNHGLSPSQISRLVLVAPVRFRCPDVVAKLQYYGSLFGSFDNLLKELRKSNHYLSTNLERVLKPNVALLKECGLDVCDIAKLSRSQTRLITTNPGRVQTMVERAEGIGVRRGSRMFRHALEVVAFCSKEMIITKVELLKKTFRWSDAEVGIAVSRFPSVLKGSKDRLRRVSEFLNAKVGLEPEYIAHRPALVTYSLECRLMPRYYVLKFLKDNGLLDHDRSYYTVAKMIENDFMKKLIHPYKEVVPTLAQDYAAACQGEVPTTFRSQELSTGLASV